MDAPHRGGWGHPPNTTNSELSGSVAEAPRAGTVVWWSTPSTPQPHRVVDDNHRASIGGGWWSGCEAAPHWRTGGGEWRTRPPPPPHPLHPLQECHSASPRSQSTAASVLSKLHKLKTKLEILHTSVAREERPNGRNRPQRNHVISQEDIPPTWPCWEMAGPPDGTLALGSPLLLVSLRGSPAKYDDLRGDPTGFHDFFHEEVPSVRPWPEMISSLVLLMGSPISLSSPGESPVKCYDLRGEPVQAAGENRRGSQEKRRRVAHPTSAAVDGATPNPTEDTLDGNPNEAGVCEPRQR